MSAASVVDHIKPHKKDPALFWDQENWQALCKPCHDSVKQKEERGRRGTGADVNGEPLDAGHYWNSLGMPGKPRRGGGVGKK